MSREEMGQEPPLVTPVSQAREALRRFQESRLFMQVVLSAALVGITALVNAMPATPRVQPVRRALTWTARADYDFVGQARKAQGWAQARGGWSAAVSGLWAASVDRAKEWGTAHLPAFKGLSSSGAPRPIWPVKDPVLLRGFAWLPPALGDQVHEGIDLGAPVGTPAMAIADGTVTRVGSEPALGTVVEIDHGQVIALYGQLDKVLVKPGNQVKQGQTLASIARPSGAEKSMESHLHLEIHRGDNGKRVDPALFLGGGGTKL